MTGNEHFEQKIAYHTKQRKVSNKWFAPYKEIQVSLEFCIPRRGLLRIPGIPVFVSGIGFWIPIVSEILVFLSYFLDSKAQDSGWISQGKFFWIPDSTNKNFSDFGIRIPWHGANGT